MTYRAHVRNGVAVLDHDAKLPEGAHLLIEVVENQFEPSLAERFANVIGTCPDLPSDMAQNHDHYVHGKPRS